MASHKLIVLVALFGCGGGGNSGTVDAPSGIDSSTPPNGTAATATFAAVRITDLPGASQNAGVAGVFTATDLVPGAGAGPALSNTIVSAIPGAPPKPVFVGQATAFDAVLVSVDGETGFFDVPAGTNNTIVALDLVTVGTATHGFSTINFATRTGTTISATTSMRLFVDEHVFIAAGDLENHDTDGTNIADLFGAVLEGKQGNPAMPMQVVDGHNNNADVDANGIKGDVGPVATGHREVVWDGVPEVLRNVKTFSPTFFDRQTGGAAGVQGGVVFTPVGGTGEEVNDALGGVKPSPATVGPPTNPNAPLGGDFSDLNPAFAGDLLAFTQDAVFAPIGTNKTDITFHVAASNTTGVVTGMGVVFISVNKTVVPARSAGPFPVPGPLTAAPNAIPFSFAGWIDNTKRVARVRITSGEVAVDKATLNDHVGTPDVVVLDDIYYSEPQP